MKNANDISDAELRDINDMPPSRSTREFNMFGCMVEDLRAFATKYIGKGKMFETKEAALTSILSDVQEEVAAGLTDRARKNLNRVKWLLNEA